MFGSIGGGVGVQTEWLYGWQRVTILIFLFFVNQRSQTEVFGDEKELTDKTKFDNIQIDENMYFTILFFHFSSLKVGILGYARAGVKIRNLSL